MRVIGAKIDDEKYEKILQLMQLFKMTQSDFVRRCIDLYFHELDKLERKIKLHMARNRYEFGEDYIEPSENDFVQVNHPQCKDKLKDQADTGGDF